MQFLARREDQTGHPQGEDRPPAEARSGQGLGNGGGGTSSGPFTTSTGDKARSVLRCCLRSTTRRRSRLT